MKIVWSPEALADLADIAVFIQADNPAAARRVALRILAAVKNLRPLPRMGVPDSVTGTRKLFIPGLPYFVPYRIEGTTLLVLRVYHTSRRWPGGE